MDSEEKKQTALLRWLHSLSSMAPGVWAFVKSWFWQALAVVSIVALAFAAVRPLAGPPDPTSVVIATAWNQSIARLGILPVFPPEEDLYVGDVWAVVADSEETPLLGKAVRIAHIDLRASIWEDRKGRPIFADTAELKQEQRVRRQENQEMANAQTGDRKIALTLAAFPGITINHTTRAAGSFGANFLGISAGRDDQEREEIRITTAETYGAPALAAFLQLDEWCSNDSTKIYCTDAFVRRIMAYSVSDRVLATRDGRYIARLQLRLVTRVFLTREIEHRRHRKDASNAALSRSQSAPPLDPTQRGDSDKPPDQTGVLPASPRVPTANASVLRDDGTEIYLREVFQRPVVFGYRSVTVNLAPSRPSEEVLR